MCRILQILSMFRATDVPALGIGGAVVAPDGLARGGGTAILLRASSAGSHTGSSESEPLSSVPWTLPRLRS